MGKERDEVRKLIEGQFIDRDMGSFGGFVGEPSKISMGGTTYLYVWQVKAEGWESEPVFALVTTNRAHALDAVIIYLSSLVEATLKAVQNAQRVAGT